MRQIKILSKFFHNIGFNRSRETDENEIEPIVESENKNVKPLTLQEIYALKNRTKHLAKRKIPKKKRFTVGKKYLHRIKNGDKTKEITPVYECKKVIYSLNDNIINIVIMKKISGEFNSSNFLSKSDCKMFHIKYEPGLEVWKMCDSKFKEL